MSSKLSREQIHQRIADTIIPEDPRVNLDEYQAAKLLNCSVHKLRRDRWAGGGIPFIKLSDNGMVRYCRSDIDERVSAKRYASTSQYQVKRKQPAAAA